MRIPLELAPGLVSDETTHSTPGRWADGNNVRFRDGRPEVIGGWAKYHATLLSGVCRSSLGWIDALGVVNIALGTHTDLYVIKGGEMAEITPAGLIDGEIDTIEFAGGYGSGGYGMGGYGVGETEAAARTWSLANWGESLMASPAGGGIYWWQNDPLTVAAIVSNAPTSVDRMTVAPTRQVVAMGCAEETSGVYNPMCVRISEIEDATDWTTAPDNNVSENILPGGGKIIDGRPYGDGMILWTDNALFVGTFIGAAEQSWRFDRIAVGCGLIGPQAAVVINQAAYWLTADMQFFAYQFGGVPTPMACPIRRDISENIDSGQTAKIVAASIGEFQEVWWFYPDTRDNPQENRFYQSEDLTASVWAKSNVTATDGGELDLLVPSAGVTTKTISQSFTANAAGDQVTVSFDFDASGYSEVLIRCGNPAETAAFQVTADLTAGTINTPNAYGGAVVTSGTITLVSAGRYRVALSGSVAGVTDYFCVLYILNAGAASFAGDGVSGVYVGKAQAEVGSASTYERTTTHIAGDSAEVSRYVAVSTVDGSWFRGDVARTAFMDSGPLRYPMGVSYAGQSYLHEYEDDADGSALTWHIESALQYLGEGERRLLVRGIWPDFEAQTGSVSLTLKHRSYPQSSDVTKGPYALAAGREKKDFLAEGRLFSIKLSGSAVGTFMRLGKPSFDAVATGER